MTFLVLGHGIVEIVEKTLYLLNVATQLLSNVLHRQFYLLISVVTQIEIRVKRANAVEGILYRLNYYCWGRESSLWIFVGQSNRVFLLDDCWWMRGKFIFWDPTFLADLPVLLFNQILLNTRGLLALLNFLSLLVVFLFFLELYVLWQGFTSSSGCSLDKFDYSFFDLMVWPFALGFLPFVDQWVISIFYHVLGSAALEDFYYVGPFGPIALHHWNEDIVFLSGPFIMVYLRVDVICPSLATLSIGAEVATFTQSEQFEGNFLPFESFVILRQVLNNFGEKGSLLVFPWQFGAHLGRGHRVCLEFDSMERFPGEDGPKEEKILIFLYKWHITNDMMWVSWWKQ